MFEHFVDRLAMRCELQDLLETQNYAAHVLKNGLDALRNVARDAVVASLMARRHSLLSQNGRDFLFQGSKARWKI